MTHRMVRTRRGGIVRRETEWLDIQLGEDTVASTGSAVLSASLGAQGLALRPFTVIRTILDVRVESNQAAASERQIAAIGLAVVSDQAVAIGITAVPTPITDLGSDLWFLHRSLMNGFVFGDATGFISSVGQVFHEDSRAARKVNGDQDVILVVENGLATGSVISSIGRMLVKLH